MKTESHKYFLFDLLIGIITISAMTNLCIAESKPATMDRYSLVLLAMEQLCQADYDSVFILTDILCERDPDDPVAYFIAADAYNTMIRDYRVRKFEAKFDSLLSIAIRKADYALEKKPTAENYFLSGAAKGYRSFYWYRSGKWLKAIKGAVNSIGLQKQALRLDSGFVDPLLCLGLFDYAQSKLPLGIFAGKRDNAIQKLEKTRKEGKYVADNALCALQMIYYEIGDFEKAFEMNEQLYRRYPQNLGCLYNRALLQEKKSCLSEALLIWEQIISRIKALEHPSNGYLAECHYHLATIYLSLGNEDKAWEEIIRSAKYASRYCPIKEMDGPYMSFSDIKREINRALRSWSRQK